MDRTPTLMRYVRVAFIAALALSACGKVTKPEELPGRYVFSWKTLRQEIRIEAAGGYDNSYYAGTIRLWSERGTWDWDETWEDHQLTFNTFRFSRATRCAERRRCADFERYTPQSLALRGFWPVTPERTLFGSIKLCFGSEGYLCFEAEGRPSD